MNFSEIVAEVISITKRPDLQARTESAVRAATLRMHQSDFYYKDLFEVPVQFAAEEIVQNFLPTDIFPRFRKVKYLRYWMGDANGSAGQFLKAIQVENSLDAYGCFKNNVYYMAGQLLQIRTQPAVLRVLFGAYCHPAVTPAASYSSWIADEYPYAIIYDAARAIFLSISLLDQANAYSQLTGEVLTEIKLSCVDDVPLT